MKSKNNILTFTKQKHHNNPKTMTNKYNLIFPRLDQSFKLFLKNIYI